MRKVIKSMAHGTHGDGMVTKKKLALERRSS
jgi:hypothetical protein